MPYELIDGNNYRLPRCEVVDGDTVTAAAADVYDNWTRVRIRLHGIDAPELSQPYGAESAQHLLNLLQADPRPLWAYVTDSADIYGRVVAILHHGDVNDSVNARLVRDGLAYAYYGNEYREAERSAKAARVGVWQQKGGGIRPWNYRRGRGNGGSVGCGCLGALAAVCVIGILLLLLLAAAG